MFDLGEKVQMVTGGPIMTVIAHNRADRCVRTSWLLKSGSKRAVFGEAMLRPCPDAPTSFDNRRLVDHENGITVVAEGLRPIGWLSVDTGRVPHLSLSWEDGPDEAAPEWQTRTYWVTVDDRLAFGIGRDELFGCARMLANAMAVAAGFSSFGRNSVPMNPYASYAADDARIDPADLKPVAGVGHHTCCGACKDPR